MKLKKLELYGFKSFADRTVFEFEDSLSALVGPNGSGKSNIVDAIKWVLGERSARKLRGSEMTNLIFGGSESRKPLGFAEVKLTIDNSNGWLPVDYEEVCIGRRLDRSGQCDYFLNGSTCRLKDIRALLLDTGVGTSSYSFIEQGQIDRVLNASAKERRLIFEEAAGINRYLEQRREAERKLERVGTNLARVTDIIEEVQRQLRSVKYQAARARTFRRHTERLEKLRLADSLHTVRRLEAERQDCSQRIEAAAAERGALVRKADAGEAQLDAARSRLQQTQAELAEAREHLTRVEARLDGLARESELNRRRSEELQGRLAQLDERRRASLQRTGELDEELAAARSRLERAARELDEKSAQFQENQQRVQQVRDRRRDVERGIEAAKARVFELFQRESHLHNQTEVLAAERRALHGRLLRIENRRKELAEQLDAAEAERSRTRQHADALQTRQAGLEAELRRLRAEIEDADRRLTALTGAESETRAELSNKVGRRDVLRDLEERAEGVRAGVKHLVEADPPGMVGLVADLLEVPLPWAPAVEAALAQKAQAVVFEEAAQAQRALRLLADAGNGRAEVIVQEHVTRPARTELGPLPDVEGRLSEMVRCDERAAAVVDFLLLNTFLVTDAEAAAAFLRAGLPQGVRLVTPEGQCFGADGVWVGGSPETPSLISRRSELAALDADIARLEARLAELAAETRDCRSRLKGLTDRRSTVANEAEHVGRQVGELSAHLQAVDSRAGELREELNVSRAEEATIRQDVRRIDAESAELRRDSEQTVGKRTEAQGRVEAAQEGLRALEEEEHTLTAETGALGSELARTREQQRSLQALLERLNADRRRVEAESTSLVAEQESGERRRREALDALEAARAEQERFRAEQGSLNESIEARSRAVREAEGGIAALAEAQKVLARQREEAEENLQNLRMLENEASVRLDALLRRTAEDLGVRLHVLEREPETWAEEPPFSSKLIRELSAEEPEQPSAVAVAAWYRESEGEQPKEEDEGAEVVSLDEAIALRSAVLELADDPATDWPALKAEAAQLKAKVERIGNVNVAAIREQEELEIRFQFLTDQKEDLEKARRHQREIIRELNAKSRKRFRETFEQVRQNFQALFRKLFGGGTADIVLDEAEEDVLEAGIEMIARPPGKEATSITLLSGGERALTTVALLFAMFQAKPSPFCLLDEVDAPLDDANVERFLMMLEDFRRDTQFVIITHNKLSMSVAQVLYGLTMADGVSRKISVKFTEVDRHLEAPPVPRAKAG